MQKIIILIFILSSSIINAQLGCTDPQAINFDASASNNDGSCTYSTTNYSLNLLDTLPDTLSENSGIIFWNGHLYTHNDSDNSTEIFELDTATLNITKRIYLMGISNNDWEDIAQDDHYIYIGDIGNNDGSRTNLMVYKFLKSAISSTFLDTIHFSEIEIIRYLYPDQSSYTPSSNNTPFDCESIIFYQNQLHVFTKNWTGPYTVHYSFPNTAGTHVATRLDSLNTGNILITGADITNNKQLMLIGYMYSTTPNCAFWYIHHFDSTSYFFNTGHKRKIDLGSALSLGQVEAVCFIDSFNGFVSNERFNPISIINVPQKLYRFSSLQWFSNNNHTAIQETTKEENLLKVIYNNGIIYIDSEKYKKSLLTISIYSLNGILNNEIKCQINENGQSNFSIKNITTGHYIITIKDENEIKYTKLIVIN